MVTRSKGEWSYLAGLIDGEGSFVISRQWRSHLNCWNYSFKLKISNTSERIVRWIQERFGGAVYENKPPKKDKWSSSFEWRCARVRENEILILGALPYLSTKWEHARLALKFLRLPSYANVPAEREALYSAMQDLNARPSVRIKRTGKQRSSYLAALVDGEGTIGLYKDNRCEYYQPSLRVANKDCQMLEWIRRFYGANVYGPNKHGVYAWQETDAKVAGILEDIRPFLVIKREQADVLKAAMLGDLSCKRSAYLKLKNLNLRGPVPSVIRTDQTPEGVDAQDRVGPV